MLGLRDQLFDAHARDVQRRQMHTQIRVAFIGADDEPARLGDGEVDAGECRVGTQKMGTQVLAGRFRQVLGIGRRCWRAASVRYWGSVAPAWVPSFS